MAQHGTIYQQKSIIRDADGNPVLDANGEPTMKLRSAKWWISYRDANGKRKWESAHSTKKGDAQRLLNLRLGATEKHEIVGPEIGRVTFDEAVKAVMNDQKMNGRRSTTREQGRIDKHLTPYFGVRRMTSITTDLMTAYFVARQQAGASNGTINRERQIIVRAFRLAVRAGKLTSAPHVPKLPEPKQPRKGFFEHAEFEACRDQLPTHLRGLLTFFYWTGWRLSEALGLHVRQVTITDGVMTLDPAQCKSADGRRFDFGPLVELRNTLTEQIGSAERIGKANDKIVTSVFHEPDGSPIKPAQWRKAWEAARAAAGFPTKKVHDFRRTAARNLERAGVSRTVAMAMIGHKTESIYRRYSIVDEARMREEAEKLQAWALGQHQKPAAKASGRVRQFERKQFGS